MTVEDIQKQHEAEIDRVIAKLSGGGADSDWALARALVHRAMHMVAERRAGEFCVVAGFLAEMIGHAHQLLHPGDKSSPAHSATVH